MKLKAKKQHQRKNPPTKSVVVILPMVYAEAATYAAHSLGFSRSKFLAELLIGLIEDKKGKKRG